MLRSPPIERTFTSRKIGPRSHQVVSRLQVAREVLSCFFPLDSFVFITYSPQNWPQKYLFIEFSLPYNPFCAPQFFSSVCFSEFQSLVVSSCLLGLGLVCGLFGYVLVIVHYNSDFIYTSLVVQLFCKQQEVRCTLILEVSVFGVRRKRNKGVCKSRNIFSSNFVSCSNTKKKVKGKEVQRKKRKKTHLERKRKRTKD